jgi:anti-sigma factor RsiW
MGGSIMHRRATINEEELHAYIDGALDRDRSLDIALYLAGHPAEAARIEAYRAQREGIGALFDYVLDQRPPDRLSQMMRRPGAGTNSRR